MKLYVGNLPYSVDAGRLQRLFEPFGEVLSAQVVTDITSGRSKGFGFVEMVGPAADAAVKALNRSEIEGRTVWVQEARVRA